MTFKSQVVIPADGKQITADENGKLTVQITLLFRFIRGDGIGADISPVMRAVIDAAVQKAYSGRRKLLGW